MSLEVGFILFAIVILIGLSAFLRASETAFENASRARMHALETEGDARAKRVNALLEAPEKLSAALLFGSKLLDLLAAALAAGLAMALLGGAGLALAIVILSIVIAVFAIIVPRTYALARPDQTALVVAPTVRYVVGALTPIAGPLSFLIRQVVKLSPARDDDASSALAAHEEIRDTIQLQTKEGAVARNDAAMLGGVLDLMDLQVADIMVHRTKMETVNADDPPSKILDELLRTQYTRMPIWRDEPENIVGTLHTKDLLSALGRAGWEVDKLDIMSFAAEPWFVPDTTSLKTQLNQFLKQKHQMALVVDEYGEVQGLITLEDILEEIVGQIADEHDTHEAAIRPQADGTVNVDGTVAVRDLNRQMNWSLPDEEATTVAGLVIHEAQAIPEPGQTFTFHSYRFEILRKARNKITALRVKPIDSGNEAGPVRQRSSSI